jgi:TPR repeat protein
MRGFFLESPGSARAIEAYEQGDSGLAFSLFSEAADDGNLAGQYNLGICFE